MKKTLFLIGIDLGTTNSTVAYARIDQPESTIEQLEIPQIVGASTQDKRLYLPSFLYFPLPEETEKKLCTVDWDAERNHCVGEFARQRGAELPDRVVTSAKSWLSCSGIDRRAQLLPLDGENKISPMHTCAEFLKHIQEVWDIQQPETPFKNQKIIITVPASFYPEARQLIQEAAEEAGYPPIILLEEPQAAFYAWLHDHAEEWRQQLKQGDTILVVDIGGGTTDFSLISAENEEGNLSLNRVAVGSHLLLGGDNLDYCLAYFVKQQIEEKGKEIDERQFQSLLHLCRQAKEVLLGENPPSTYDITVMGKGSKLIGGAIKTTIKAEDVHRLLIDGFFPLVSYTDMSPAEKHIGLQQVGLPYAQDPRISSQLAKFLSLSGESNTAQTIQIPTAVLFNGGTLKSSSIRNRMIDLLNSWANEHQQPPIKVLSDADYDFAVSRGAVYYGKAREGQRIRIRSGTSRSYFVGVQEAAPAIPGLPAQVKAVCVVPYGMEEGTEQTLENQEFALMLGEQATFRFFCRSAPLLSDDTEPVMGTVVKRWGQELTELSPIVVQLDREETDGKTVKVRLKSKITELGMLELWCENDESRRWKLEFDLRKVSSDK